MVAQNVKNINERIASACARAKRKVDEVTLVAVSKAFGPDRVAEAAAAGVVDFGENYVQELRAKYELLQNTQIRWHFIGHLQSNKVRVIIPWITCIHAVDSESLGREISRQAVRSARSVDVLIEVNTTAEQSKYGIPPDHCRPLAEKLVLLPGIRLIGLMTIGPFLPDPEQSRPAFRRLRELKERLVAAGVAMRHLSMGMTNDFEVAIDEGATMIRVGTAIFGARSAKKN